MMKYTTGMSEQNVPFRGNNEKRPEVSVISVIFLFGWFLALVLCFLIFGFFWEIISEPGA